jgi:hypothetical protein
VAPIAGAAYASLPLSLETGFADLLHSGALPEPLGIAQVQPELERDIAYAIAAYRTGDRDDRSYVDTIGDRAARQQAIALEQSRRAAMAAPIGAGMPAITHPPQEASR